MVELRGEILTLTKSLHDGTEKNGRCGDDERTGRQPRSLFFCLPRRGGNSIAPILLESESELTCESPLLRANSHCLSQNYAVVEKEMAVETRDGVSSFLGSWGKSDQNNDPKKAQP